MKTLLSALLAAAFAISAVSVLPSARADAVTCTADGRTAGEIVYALTLDTTHRGRCYDGDICQASDGTVTYGFNSNPFGSCEIPILSVRPAPVDCATVDGYAVTVTWFGAGGPLEQTFDVCVGQLVVPPSPVVLGPCGPGGRGTGVFLSSGSQVACLDSAILPGQVAPCYHLGMLTEAWVGVSVGGSCIAVGLCQYNDSDPGVRIYRNGAPGDCVHV